MTLTLCTDVTPADWLGQSTRLRQDVATFGPAVYEAYARLRFTPDPAYPEQPLSDLDPGTSPGQPTEADLVARACTLLAAHTSTPDDCYFCLWVGWPGVPKPTSSDAVVRLDARTYYLYRGSVSDVDQWGSVSDNGSQPAAFIWPSDRAWCVASDVDPHWAGIGASQSAINLLVADDGLDVVHANPTEPQPEWLS